MGCGYFWSGVRVMMGCGGVGRRHAHARTGARASNSTLPLKLILCVYINVSSVLYNT